MDLHESSVNYQNLIRDLAEMYPCDVSEVVLTELVANALDAKATHINIDFDPSTKTLVVADDGCGMDATQFDEYHDFAAGLKTRGTGIGFAGVGAKISFNIASRVITETRNQSFCGGSNWYLESKKRLVWEDVVPRRLADRGTRVEVRFKADSRLAYTTTGDLLELLRRNYLPLFDMHFLDLYGQVGCYTTNLRFTVNGEAVLPGSVVDELQLENCRTFFPVRRGKRIGYGVLGLASSEYPLGLERCGVLLCTWGKVIRAELFNQFPGPLGPRVFGVVEIPELVGFLTTSKTDFIRGKRHREFEGLYSPVREEFKDWLSSLGVSPVEVAGISETVRLEREISKLINDVPELAEFFGFRTKKPILTSNTLGDVPADLVEGARATLPDGAGVRGKEAGPADVGEDVGQALVRSDGNGDRRAEPISRTARRGPRISLFSAPERVDLAWVEGESVVINSGHPCYTRTQSNSLARTFHSLYSIGIAVSRFMSQLDDTNDPFIVDRMMASWGKK